MTQFPVRYLKFLRSILKVALPFTLLACLVAPLYGRLVHWAPADAALLRYKSETAIMVGSSYRSHSMGSDRGLTNSIYRERVYILFPSMLREPKTVTVSQVNNNPYQISEDKNGALNALVMYGLILFGVWWFWLRRPGKP